MLSVKNWKKEFTSLIKSNVIIYEGKILSITFKNRLGQYHNIDNPACFLYSTNGKLIQVRYYINGEPPISTTNKKYPAFIDYIDDKKYTAHYYIKKQSRSGKIDYLLYE